MLYALSFFYGSQNENKKKCPTRTDPYNAKPYLYTPRTLGHGHAVILAIHCH